MKTRQTLKPGRAGTLRYVEEYGEKLVRVRHYFDPLAGRRVTTAEIVVEDRPWKPGRRMLSTLVALKVAYHEKATIEQVKAAGARWDWENSRWLLPFGKALQLGLFHRIDEKYVPGSAMRAALAERRLLEKDRR